jgi:F0F1-type ATP synthase membrane subunit b/b'
LTAHELTHTIQQGAAVRMNKEVRRKPNQQFEEKEQLQAKNLPDRTLKDSLNKELRLQPLQEQEEGEPLQAKEIPAQTPEVSSNKELRLQPLQEQEEGEPLQAKEIPAQTPEVSSNKELRLQPLQEQEETEPLQAKELPGHNPEASLNKELRRQPEGTSDGMIQAKTLESGFTPSPLSIQRGIRDLVSNGWNKTKDFVGAGLGKGRDLLTGGLDWVKNNIIQPLMRLASSGWSSVKGFGGHIGNAYKQANPTIWDVFWPQHLLFRMARNQRRQLFAQAIQAERSQQAKAAAGVQSSGPAPVREPSQLERLNELAEKIESVPAAGFNVGKELLEGAVVGDFKENPTIWNTIGQVAIGFVPYAGQVADIRDLVANVKKLHETGYKDPDAWINLVLTGIGFIPGVGDIIKAVGKGSKGAIRKALSGVLKNADNILRPVLGKAKGLLNGARRYGKQFLGWASRQGARLRQGVTRFAQKTVNFAKAAGQRARGLVTALNSRIGGFVNGATQRARDVANQGRGLLGKVMGPFMGMATKAFDAVQSRVWQAVNMVKTEAQRGKYLALKVGRKVVDVTPKATTLLKEFTQSAIQKGRQAVQKAKQWSSQQIEKATELGRRLVAQARKRVADKVGKGVKLAKEKAVTWIKQKIGGIKQRVLGFLKDKWNRLKEKLGIKKPGEAGKQPEVKPPETAVKPPQTEVKAPETDVKSPETGVKPPETKAEVKAPGSEVESSIAGQSKMATGTATGKDPTPDTIREGSVRMEQHPQYQETIRQVTEAGFEIKVSDGARIEVKEVVDSDGNVIRVEKTLYVQQNMRYLHLEHELGHIKQLERFGNNIPPTERVTEQPNGTLRTARNQEGILTVWQNTITEYHNRLDEFIRLHERGASPELLKEHADGVEEWYKEYWKKGIKQGRSNSQTEWAEKYFPEIAELRSRYLDIVKTIKQ